MRNPKPSLCAGSELVLGWTAGLLLMQLLTSLIRPLLTDTWQRLLLTVLNEVTFFLGPLILVRKKEAFAVFASPKEGEAKTVLMAGLLALCVYPVVSVLQNGWLLLIEFFGGVPQETSIPELENAWEILLAFLAMAICPAVVEELCLRGALLPALRSRFSPAVSITITAAVFSLMHSSFSALPYTFLLGWLLGWLTIRSRSLYPAVVFHGITNGIAVIIGLLSQKADPVTRGEAILGALPAAAGALAAAVGLVLIFRRITVGSERTRTATQTPKRWWVPMAIGLVVLSLLVLYSAVETFCGGISCV